MAASSFHPIEESLSVSPSFDSFAMDDAADGGFFSHRESRSEPMNNSTTGSIFRTGAEYDADESENDKTHFRGEETRSSGGNDDQFDSIVSHQVHNSSIPPSVMLANPITSAACSPAHDWDDYYCELGGVDETDDFNPYPYASHEQEDEEMKYQEIAPYLSSWSEHANEAFATETRQESIESNEQILKPCASRGVDYNAFFKVGRSSSMSAVMFSSEAENSREDENCFASGKPFVRRHTVLIPMRKPIQIQRSQPMSKQDDDEALQLCVKSDSKCYRKHAAILSCQDEFTTLQRGKSSFLDDEFPASCGSFSSPPQWE